MKFLLILSCISFFNYTLYGQDTLTVKVAGSCEMCKDRIESAASNVIGILHADYSIEHSELTVAFDKSILIRKDLIDALLNVGHDADEQKAPEDIYDSLPNCCKYNDPQNVHNTKENHIQSADSGHEHNENEVQLLGKVFEQNDLKTKLPVIGATISWLNTAIGTTTNDKGEFSLPFKKSSELVISYLGMKSDTIAIAKAGNIEIVLDAQTQELGEVEIKHRRKTTEVSYINTIKTKNISQKELQKAACCNLSESFSTNPAIDVSYTDAVTGTKQIEMLGLAGPYVQITRENIPDIRGLSSLYGFTYIPGPWVESMQMNLGTGSVINGFESIAGQLNVEIKKPNDKEKLHVNGYYSQGRIEGNVIANTTLTPKWKSNVLLHYNDRYNIHDRNADGFLDMPTGSSFIVSNNYHFQGENGNEGQIGLKYTTSDQFSGQDSHLHEGSHPAGFRLWQSNIKSDRYEMFLKRGKVFVNRPNSSLGFQMSTMYHNQASFFGNTSYDSNQKMIYGNLIYQTIIGTTDHKLTMGSSIIAEKYDETINQKNYLRKEIVPGVFGEYSYSMTEKFDLVLGMRMDHHNNFGLFVTPRLHTRYAFNEFTVLRGSVGRGQRTANIFAENIGIFASSRKIDVRGTDPTLSPYGLKAEAAWNVGANLTRNFTKLFKGLSWEVDLYHTQFENQIVIDYDSNPQTLSFYNLDGKSYSTSIQNQIDFSPIDRFDIRMAYRYNIVRTTYGENLLQKPLTSPQRAFINMAYETRNAWKFDITANWQSSKRLPNTFTNPVEFRFASQSPSLALYDFQISKSFLKNRVEVYFGIENVFNERQKNAILSNKDPFSDYFDSTIVWGPVFGRNSYIGFRYRLFNKEE